jgi:hypothetical protein
LVLPLPLPLFLSKPSLLAWFPSNHRKERGLQPLGVYFPVPDNSNPINHLQLFSRKTAQKSLVKSKIPQLEQNTADKMKFSYIQAHIIKFIE